MAQTTTAFRYLLTLNIYSAGSTPFVTRACVCVVRVHCARGWRGVGVGRESQMMQRSTQFDLPRL